jgi:hypothetical protein
VADGVFVFAAVAVPQEVCVAVLELCADAVYVAEEVDVFVDEPERVSTGDRVPLDEKEPEPVEDIVRGGMRVREPVAVSVFVGRRETLPETDAVGLRDCLAVAEPVGVVVYVGAGRRVTEPLRDTGGLRVSALQRVGDGEADCVFV